MSYIVVFFLCIACSTVVSMALMAGLFEFERKNYEELSSKIKAIKMAMERGMDDGK